MLGLRKRTIAVFLLGLALGVPGGARLQTRVDLTRWPPALLSSGLDVSGRVVLAASGGGIGAWKTDTETFRVPGPFRIYWSGSPPGERPTFGTLSITLAGGAFDAVGGGVGTPQGVTEERHADCSAGCYLTVRSSDLTYRITVAQ